MAKSTRDLVKSIRETVQNRITSALENGIPQGDYGKQIDAAVGSAVSDMTQRVVKEETKAVTKGIKQEIDLAVKGGFFTRNWNRMKTGTKWGLIGGGALAVVGGLVAMTRNSRREPAQIDTTPMPMDVMPVMPQAEMAAAPMMAAPAAAAPETAAGTWATKEAARAQAAAAQPAQGRA